MSGSSLNQAELNAAKERATAEGFEVVVADDHTLLLDLDDVSSIETYKRMRVVLFEWKEPASINEWLSKSGNIHVMIRLTEPLAWSRRYALQAALGSDRMREMLGVIQMLNGCDEASILFKPRR